MPNNSFQNEAEKAQVEKLLQTPTEASTIVATSPQKPNEVTNANTTVTDGNNWILITLGIVTIGLFLSAGGKKKRK